MADHKFSRWWPFGSSSADKTPSPSLHMFIQDVQTRIMPYHLDSSSSELGAVFDGNEQDGRVVTRICAALAEHSSIHDSPLELVSSVVRRVSQHLVWRGSVAFELPDLREPSDEEDAVASSKVCPTDHRRVALPTTGSRRRYKDRTTKGMGTSAACRRKPPTQVCVARVNATHTRGEDWTYERSKTA